MLFDFATLDPAGIYKLMAATIVPRPIAWITSQDEQGRVNAAPFSFFNMFSADPPILGIGIGRRPETDPQTTKPPETRRPQPKDSWANIRATGGFVVHLVDEANLAAMNRTATPLPAGEDELEAAGLATVPSRFVAPPRIEASPVAFECALFHEVPLGESTGLILGRVLAMYLRDEALVDAERQHVATEKLDLVGRMHGGGWYTRTTDLLRLDRISLEAWRQGQR